MLGLIIGLNYELTNVVILVAPFGKLNVDLSVPFVWNWVVVSENAKNSISVDQVYSRCGPSHILSISKGFSENNFSRVPNPIDFPNFQMESSLLINPDTSMTIRKMIGSRSHSSLLTRLHDPSSTRKLNRSLFALHSFWKIYYKWRWIIKELI